jgi:anaerobic ribonucleoside-triphosphate reductase activating protein
MDNDVVDGMDVCVSLWVQGCPHHCKNCHNESTWDFNAGTEINVDELSNIIIDKISANDVIRNFSILGGEPLCKENINQVAYIISKVRKKYNDIKIFVWTGSLYEDIYKQIPINESAKIILDNIDMLIDGPYIDEKRNLKLFLRGSENQRLVDVKMMRELNKWNIPIIYNV